MFTLKRVYCINCNNCENPAMEIYDNNSDRELCKIRLNVKIVNPVHGDYFVKHIQYCKDKNWHGHCKDYKEVKK